MKQLFLRIITAFKNRIHSKQGKNIVLFMSCLLISYIFWILLNLNNEVQQEFTVPIELVNKPDSITLIDELPSNIHITIKDKGSNLIKHQWGRTSNLKLKFNDHITSEDKFFLTKSEIETKMRSRFGSNAQIVSLSPDSLKSTFTSKPGKKIKIEINGKASANYQYVIGDIIASIDSADVYSLNKIPQSLKVETNHFSWEELKDSITFTAKLKSIPGYKIIPDEIDITIPVEPLISKKKKIIISNINTPNGYNLITFPSTSEIDFLVPMSKYSEKDTIVKVIADFKQSHNTDKLPLNIINAPSYWQNISIKPDSVEFIIEQRQ